MVAWNVTRAFIRPKGMTKIRSALHAFEMLSYGYHLHAFGSGGTRTQI